MDLTNLIVGEKLDYRMPDEGMSIVLINGAPMLTFNFSVSEKDITAFLHGSTCFGLFIEKNVLFFLFKIEGLLDWSDLAFTIHLTQDESIQDNGGYLSFHLILVEASTSLIKAIRVVTVSPSFRSIFSGITLQQANERFDTINYYKNIRHIDDAYPTSGALLKKAVIIENGGITLAV